MLVLPWPPKSLSPNARVHWRTRHAAAKKYRADCYMIASMYRKAVPETGNIALRITFHPPDKRRRDDDNCVSSFKAGRDGIAQAWGVDDSSFRPVTYSWGDVRPSGQVVVELRNFERD
jgi:crossover junction endodeoxyribonuclease RusA